jgi:transketolase
VHTMKPLEEAGIIDALQKHRDVIVIEETGPTGSLGSRVKALAWDARAKCRIAAFGLKDQFIHCYGSHDDLLAAHGLSADRILSCLAAR